MKKWILFFLCIILLGSLAGFIAFKNLRNDASPVPSSIKDIPITSTSEKMYAVEIRMQELEDAMQLLPTISANKINTILIVLPAPVTIKAPQEDPNFIVATTKNLIDDAKKYDLQIAFTVDVPVVADVDPVAYEDLMPDLQTYVERYARFAESNGAIYFQVANEVNNLFGSAATTQEIQSAIDALLATASGAFSGNIGIGFDLCRQVRLDQCGMYEFNFDFTGYDALVTSVYLSERSTRIVDPVSQYMEYENAMLTRLEEIAEASFVEFIYLPVKPGDIWARNTSDCDQYLCYPLTPDQEKEFYRNMFEQFSQRVDGRFVRLSVFQSAAKDEMK